MVGATALDIDTILVPIDFSDCSEEVVRGACEIARRFQADLVLLHVMEPLPGLDMDDRIVLGAGPNARRAAVKEHLTHFATERLPRLSRIAYELGVSATCRLEQGSVADAIVGVADRVGADLIVMGTHGRRGPAYVALHSIASSVIRRATCPVTTFRFQHKPGCRESSCMWCETGVLGLRRRISVASRRGNESTS